ncbi:MAG TPA: hypothetical protein VJ890_01285, partial [Vineibacter sp.]|nr:hypothetical protein [Vineibacter sp.]
MTKFQAIDINDLPQWSDWPARLLGLTSFTPPVRTPAKIEEEYGQIKYATCLKAWQESGETLDATQLRLHHYAQDPAALRPAVYKGKILAVPATQIVAWYDALLAEWMAGAIGKARTVVELGTGFGHILWSLRQ